MDGLVNGECRWCGRVISYRAGSLPICFWCAKSSLLVEPEKENFVAKVTYTTPEYSTPVARKHKINHDSSWKFQNDPAKADRAYRKMMQATAREMLDKNDGDVDAAAEEWTDLHAKNEAWNDNVLRPYPAWVLRLYYPEVGNIKGGAVYNKAETKAINRRVSELMKQL